MHEIHAGVCLRSLGDRHGLPSDTWDLGFPLVPTLSGRTSGMTSNLIGILSFYYYRLLFNSLTEVIDLVSKHLILQI